MRSITNIPMQSSDENICFLFNYSSPFLLSHIIEIHGATKVPGNITTVSISKQKFRCLYK